MKIRRGLVAAVFLAGMLVGLADAASAERANGVCGGTGTVYNPVTGECE